MKSICWPTNGLVRLACSGAVLAGFLLLCPPALHAQTKDCSQPPSKKGNGADIQCHVDAVIAKHAALIQTVREKLPACAGPNCDVMQQHLDKVSAAHDRMKKMHDRMAAEDYEEVNAVRKGKCKGSSKDGDTTCYDDPQKLHVGQPDDTQGGDIVDQLDEIGKGLDSTNELLSATPAGSLTLATLRAAAAEASAFQPLYDYKTDPDYPTWLHVADNPRAIIPAAFAMKTAAVVANTASAIVHNVCEQDIFGVNITIACLPLDLLAVVLDGTAELLDYNLGDATAWDAHGAYLRAANIDGNLAIVAEGVGKVGAQVGGAQMAVEKLREKAAETEKRLGEMRQRMVVAQNQIIRLLLTPEGQRSVPASILTCDGTTTPCPIVAISCSPVTGLCSFPK